MVVMQQAMRRMVKAAQKFTKRTAAAVKMQVSSRRLVLPAITIKTGRMLCGLYSDEGRISIPSTHTQGHNMQDPKKIKKKP